MITLVTLYRVMLPVSTVGRVTLEAQILAGDQNPAKPYHHGNLWQTLVQAGIAILHEEGVHALTLRAVARRAGVSHAASYRHFADKEALLAAIAEDGFHLLVVGLADVLAHDYPDVETMIQEAGRRYVHFVLENPDHVRVMFSGLLVDYDKYPDLCESADQSFALLVEMIQRLQQAGKIAPGNPQLQGMAAWSMVHGLSSLLMEQSYPPELKEQIDIDRLTDYCVSVVYRGLEFPQHPTH